MSRNPTSAQLPQIGPYQTTAVLGRGGMAVVYRTEDNDGNEVAIKWAHPKAEEHDDVHQRLVREFTSLKRLNHPNIVKVYEMGAWDERPYYTMELVQGQNLADFIDEVMDREPHKRYNALTPISAQALNTLGDKGHIDRVISIIYQLSQAVAEIHTNNMIHRDIKPDNVFITGPEDKVTLMDFGIIKSTNQQSTQLTQVNNLIGTYKYFSPEQARSEALTYASDLYNIGLILYELMTGRFPFHSDAGIGYLFHHARTEPKPALNWNPNIPADLNKLIDTLLKKEPDDRPSSALALAEHIGNLSDTHETTDVSTLFIEMTGERLQLRLRTRWINHSHALGDLDRLFESPGHLHHVMLKGKLGVGKGRVIKEWQSRKYLGQPIIRFDCRGTNTGPLHTLNALLYHIFKQCPPEHIQQLKELRRWLAPTRQHMMRALLCMNALEDIRADLIHRVTVFMTELYQSQLCPYVLEHIDDADPMTQQLFFHWIRQDSCPFSWVMSTGAERLPETSAHIIEVRPMDIESTRQLIADMCRVEVFQIERDVAQAAHEAGRGLPGFISACLYHANLHGQLLKHGPRLTFLPIDTLSPKTTGWWHAAHAYDNRLLDNLSFHSQQVLIALAIFNRPVSLRMLLSVIEGTDDVALEQTLQALDDEGRATQEPRSQTYRLSSRIQAKDLLLNAPEDTVHQIRIQVERAIRVDKYLSRTYPETLAKYKTELGHALQPKEKLTLALRSARWGLLTEADKWLSIDSRPKLDSFDLQSSVADLNARIEEHSRALRLLIAHLRNPNGVEQRDTEVYTSTSPRTSFLQAALLKLKKHHDSSLSTQVPPRVKALIGPRAWNYWCYDRAYETHNQTLLAHFCNKMSGQSQIQSPNSSDLVRLREHRINQGMPQIFPDFYPESYAFIEDACRDKLNHILQTILSGDFHIAHVEIQRTQKVFESFGVHRHRTLFELSTLLLQTVEAVQNRTPLPPAIPRQNIPAPYTAQYTFLRGLSSFFQNQYGSAQDAFENASDLFHQENNTTGYFVAQVFKELSQSFQNSGSPMSLFFLSAEFPHQPSWAQDLYQILLYFNDAAHVKRPASTWPFMDLFLGLVEHQRNARETSV